MRGMIIAGTDTGVGKTWVAAGLLQHWATANALYWKPLQTGFPEDDDTRTVGQMTQLPASFFATPTYRLRAPMAPAHAADAEKVSIQRTLLDADAAKLRATDRPLVVEAAGGLLVPVNRNLLQIDFLASLDLPLLLVVNNRLGAINHTLLSLEACRARRLIVAGVLLNGEAKLGNRDSIERFGQVAVLGEIAPCPTPSAFLAAFANLSLPRA